MGATSVTGVGQGSSEPGKGAKNGRTPFVPALSPHVVAAGTASRSGAGTVTVTFPTPLSGSETKYAVSVTSETNNFAYVSAKTDSGGNFVSFTVSSAAAAVGDVMWMVALCGNQ